MLPSDRQTDGLKRPIRTPTDIVGVGKNRLQLLEIKKAGPIHQSSILTMPVHARRSLYIICVN